MYLCGCSDRKSVQEREDIRFKGAVLTRRQLHCKGYIVAIVKHCTPLFFYFCGFWHCKRQSEKDMGNRALTLKMRIQAHTAVTQGRNAVGTTDDLSQKKKNH